MLGSIGDARAVPVLLEVLEECSVDVDALLARDDLSRERYFQQTIVESRWPAGEDVL